MTGIITSLLKEHERALVQMTFLNDAASRLYLQGFNTDDMDVIRGSLSYISKDFHLHCEKEESKIYPGLNSYIPDCSIQQFRDDHKRITELLEMFNQIMPGINENLIAQNRALELKLKAGEFAVLFSNHIQRENDSFYLMAKHVLPEKTLIQIFKNRKQK